MTQKASALIIVAILLLVAVTIGGLAVLKNQSAPSPSKQAVTDTLIPEQTMPTPTQPAPQDETVGWKTYRNANFHFEIKYPPSFVFEEQNSGSEVNFYDKATQTKSSDHLGIFILKKPSFNSLDDYMAYLQKPQVGVGDSHTIKLEKISLDNQRSVEKNKVDLFINDKSYSLYHKGIIYIIQLGVSNSTILQTYETIARTFRFSDGVNEPRFAIETSFFITNREVQNEIQKQMQDPNFEAKILANARDVKRIEDVRQATKALALYFEDKYVFPKNLSMLMPNYDNASVLAPDLIYAISDDAKHYVLSTKLELDKEAHNEWLKKLNRKALEKLEGTVYGINCSDKNTYCLSDTVYATE